MELIGLTRRFDFRSPHSLEHGEQPEARHGHQYFLEITYIPKADAEVCAFVENRLLPQLHGRDLTRLCNPASGENLVDWIHTRLEDFGTRVLAVALQETRKNRFMSRKSERRWL